MNQIDQLKNKLPARPGFYFDEEYIETAVLVLLVFINGEYHFVFQERVPHIRQGGEICFPGGLCLPQDSSPEQAAIRETTEEMGIPAEKLAVIGRVDTLITPMGISVNPVVGTADIAGLHEIRPNRNEVQRFFSLPVSFFEKNEPQKYETLLKVHPTVFDEETGKEIVLLPALELALPDRYAKPWGNRKHIIYVYKSDQGTIWGLTAKIIVDIVKKLKS
jgi:peroxisomal coenzyme A diphosphatase NUDT7